MTSPLLRISLTFPKPMSYSLTVTESGGLTLGLTGPAGPAGPVATPLVRSEAPVNNSLQVTGTLTSGTNPVSFPLLDYIGFEFDKPFYQQIDGTASLSWDSGSGRYILSDGDSTWTSTADVATPLLVPLGAWNATTNPHAWKPTSPATGTPILSVVETAASSLGQIAIVSETDVYACTRLSPVKWTLLSNP